MVRLDLQNNKYANAIDAGLLVFAPNKRLKCGEVGNALGQEGHFAVSTKRAGLRYWLKQAQVAPVRFPAFAGVNSYHFMCFPTFALHVAFYYSSCRLSGLPQSPNWRSIGL
jgi:hypothetical protein